MTKVTHNKIVKLIGARAFGRVMSNLTRPIYVEGMVALLLGKKWKYLGDWGGWDMERDDGKRLEVKQTAVRQPWTDRAGLNGLGTTPRFDIAPRSGYWANDANGWVDAPGRFADVFVFAYHPVVDLERCDQRHVTQWRFFVLPTAKLPKDQKTIGLTPLMKLGAKEVLHNQLANEVRKHLDR